MLLPSFWKEHKSAIKYITLGFIGSSTAWVYYQINRTREILERALDTTVLQNMDQCLEREEMLEDEIIEIEPHFEYKKRGFLKWTVDYFKFAYARRLLAVAKDRNIYFRTKAVTSLANLSNLEDWHYSLISNMIDPRTEIALARTPNADRRLFREPPYRYHDFDKDQLINAMREFLMSVCDRSKHPCIAHFLSKAFVYEHNSFHIVDDDSSTLELNKFIQSEHEKLPMCLESLVHHCSLEQYSRDVADLNGLPLLMEIYLRYPDNLHVTTKLCQILSYMSCNKILLEPFHKSGWIGVLSTWINHEDIRVSIPATRALANLDTDNKALYPSNLYVLHPVNRTETEEAVDVVFVHGLLGGIFFTWRQRRKSSKTSLKENQNGRKSTMEYIQTIKDKILTDEYEIVWNDIPTYSSENCLGPFTCPGDDFNFDNAVDEDVDDYSNCWPKDWLPDDCKNIRIIGINYDTSLSMWTPLCPSEKEKLTLNERCDIIAEKLLRSGVGRRPIVWITHSMGGLIIKNILCKANKSTDQRLKDICLKTKGLVFYSTPHLGSKLANLSNAASLLLWPSVEVQELREDAPQLKAIHEEFLKIVENMPIKIVTFVETKATIVSALKLNFLIVEPKSGNPGIGEYYEIPQDHLGICKPGNRYSFLYQKVLHLIKQVKANEIGDKSK